MFAAALGALEVAKKLPWRLIGVGILVIGFVAIIGFGVLEFQHVTSENARLTGELATQTLKTAAESARADAIKAAHDEQVSRLEALEAQRSQIANEVLTLRKTIADLDHEEDIQSDNQDKADAAIARVNARSSQLNRMLEHSSAAGQLHPGANKADKASSPGAPSALGRALQALRKIGVSDR